MLEMMIDGLQRGLAVQKVPVTPPKSENARKAP
jgi:hypothetical protein